MTVSPAGVEEIYELSPLQQGMVLHTSLSPESGLYFEQVSFSVPGPLDRSAFTAAWQHAVDSHPVLRTSFYWEDLEKPLQVVHRDVRLPVHEEDWSSSTPAEQAKHLDAYLLEDRRRGFTLSIPPLMRLAIVRLGPAGHQVVWSFHHALLDGWSVQTVLRHVSAAYEALCRGQAPPTAAGAPYRRYIEWLQAQDEAAAARFWRERLAGFSAPTRFGVDRSSGAAAALPETWAEHEVYLGSEATERLRETSRRNGVTLATAAQAAWALLLSRYSGEENVAFGAVVSGRPPELEGVESMVGLFINTLPVRVEVPRGGLLAAWLRDLQAEQLEARRFEYSHLVDVHGYSDVPRGTPLFESVLVFENYPVGPSQGGEGVEARHVERTELPLTLLVVPGQRMLIKALYDARRFDADTVGRMLAHLAVVLEQFGRSFDVAPSELSLLTAEEESRLESWNDTGRGLDLERGVVEQFAGQVARRPGDVAFSCRGSELSYAELDRRSKALAGHLAQLGVGPESVVGLCVERSLDLPVALLAIVRAGGAFLPLDPSYPAERLAFMARDAQASVLLTTTALEGLFEGLPAEVVRLDADLAAEPPAHEDLPTAPDRLAYVIYTSGSTGQPKGVAVEHGQIVNRLAWMAADHPHQPGEIGCQRTAISFVDAIWELLGPLLEGKPTVIVPDEDARDPEALIDVLAAHGVTRLWMVPSLLEAMLAAAPDLAGRLPDLRFWVVSGEPLTYELAAEFHRRLPHAVLFNLYGTSEVWDATWFRCVGGGGQGSVPIGGPIANVQAHVLDDHGQPVPIGVAGELHIGGVGVARGYLGRPELSAERFVPDPFSTTPDARLYKTGDLARRLPDGNLEFLGRRDHQIKLRGYRIELEEIEAALASHPRLRAAAVTLDRSTPAGERLVAYLVPSPGHTPDPVELRGWLGGLLPEFMVPAGFVVLEALPLTANGKLDRAALPAPDGVADTGRSYTAPRTALEEALAALCRDVVGCERVGVHDDFFADLGGHSLLAARMVARVRESQGVSLSLRRFFDAPTIALLAAEIEGSEPHEDAEPALVPLDRAEYAVGAGLDDGQGRPVA